MKKIALLIGAAFPWFLCAQPKLKPGFIVKNNRDTIRGYVKPVAEKQLEDRVFFSENISSAPAVFTTNDITGFGYDGENVFTNMSYTHPYTLNTNKRFAKLLVDGYYRLYIFWQGDRSFFIINSYEDSTYLLFDDVFSNSSGIVDETGNYKNQLLYLSVPCESLKTTIEYLSYSQTAIARYVDQLNKCVSPSEENAIVYKNEKSYLNIYAYGGGIALNEGHEFAGRIIAKVTIPDLDKNMSFNFGINYMAYKRTSMTEVFYPGHKVEQTAHKSIFGVPVTLQYNFTRGRIKPYIDAGLSLDYLETKGVLDYQSRKINDTGFGIGFIIAAGIEGYVTKRLMIKADWRYELFLHYPTLGVGYFFK